MDKCPNICCAKVLYVQKWLGKWWADKGRHVLECDVCGWRWLEWG